MMKKLMILCMCLTVAFMPVMGIVFTKMENLNVYAEGEDEGEGSKVDEGAEASSGEISDDEDGGGEVDSGEAGGGGTDESDEADGDDEADENENAQEKTKIYIKAINPGYKVDGVSNAGELIEIARTGDPSTPISLAGTAVSYTKSSGESPIILVEFPENSWMIGESILLRLASSAGHELAAANYAVKGSSAGIAQGAGPLSLIQNGEVIDEVCWTGTDGCERKFKSGSGESLVRNEETGEWAFVVGYIPEYKAENYYVEVSEVVDEPINETKVVPQCKGLQFSEILSYYESEKSEQFVEFHNPGTSAVNLNGCKVRYKNKKYVLSGVVEADGYFAYYPGGFSLTKNPTNSNKLEIIDTDDAVVDTLEYPNGQRKGTAYAWLGHDETGGELWRVTYAPTPGAPNNYQEFKTCEAGKVINKVTGNCVKVTSVSEKVCKEGYYLNILTGRCNKLATTTEKTCKEGYYLNPETNRCRKIQENKGADYSLEPENYKEESSFVALYAVLGVLGLGALYLIWEFRKEILRGFSFVKRKPAERRAKKLKRK